MKVALLLLVACAHAPPSQTEIEQLSDRALAAFDRDDNATLRGLTADGFVRFEAEHLSQPKLAGGTPHAPNETRKWTERHVYAHANDAIFVGRAVEHETGNDTHGNRAYEGWYTLWWVRDGGSWRLAWSSWQMHGDQLRAIWDDNFKQDIGFTHAPNQLLVDSVKGVAPGTALDVACGQGRNALYLASQGWRVTGVDISAEGLAKAREQAQKLGVSIDAVLADVDAFEFGSERWDLVTLIYAGADSKRIAKILPSIKHGGLFVVEFFADDGTPQFADDFKPGQLAGLVKDDFVIVKDEIVDGVPDWATDKAKLQRFVARRR